MSEWKEQDEVVTTFGTIKLAQHQAHAAGAKQERDSILRMLKELTPDMHNAYGLDLARRLIESREESE
jgi:hypothetical protein